MVTRGPNHDAHALEAWLVAALAERLRVEPESIDVREPFAHYGLDSVSAVMIAEALQARLGRPLPLTLAFDYPSIEALAQHLAEESCATVCPPPERTPPAAPAKKNGTPAVALPGEITGMPWWTAPARGARTGEVQIAVRAIGVEARHVRPQFGGGIGSLPGGACVGEVVALGDDVEGLQIGDSVVAMVSAGLAPYVTVRSELAALRPAALSPTDAAAAAGPLLIAAYALKHLTRLRAGKRVLICAAGEPTGLAAVQLAQQAGAQVLASAAPDQWPLLKSLGVSHVFDARAPGFAEAVLGAADGRGVDVVLNSAPGELLLGDLSAIAPDGRLLEIGAAPPETAARIAAVRPDVSYNAADWPALVDEPALAQHILLGLIEQFEAGALRPVHHTVLTLREALDALRPASAGPHAGMMVVVLSQNGHAADDLYVAPMNWLAAAADVPPSRLRALFRARFSAAAEPDRPTLVAEYMEGQVRDVLRLNGTRIDLDQPINRMGLDSLMALELRNRVVADLGADVPLVEFLRGISIAGLAVLLAGELSAAGSTQDVSAWVEGEI